MKSVRSVLVGFWVCALMSIAAAAAAAERGTADLSGVWVAKLRYGPDPRGEIFLARRGKEYRADFAGGRAVGAARTGRLVFGLDGGELRADLDSSTSRIKGFWIQPPSNAGGGQKYATPLTLSRLRPGLWKGDIAPLDDAMTIFLIVSRDGAGKLRAFIRNPERNFGLFARTDRLEVNGRALRLVARAGNGQETSLAEGVYDPDNDLLSLHFQQFGTSVAFARANNAALPAYFPRGAAAAPYAYVPPEDLGDGWPVSTPEKEGLSSQGLAALMDAIAAGPMNSLSAPQIHAVLIARHGKLVAEEYFHGYHRALPHDLRSASKSFTSLLVGAAIARGARFDTSSRVVDLVDPKILPATIDPRLRAVRVEHLLTMNSGFDCDDSDSASPGNEDAIQEQRQEPDWWRYSLGVPMARDPGTKAVYCSMNPNLLGAVLGRQTGRWLPDLFRELIAEPMGIVRYGINLMPTGDAYLGGGIQMQPRDFLKFGQLVLDGGKWRGRAIVPQAWIERSTAPSVTLSDNGYGYLWWIVDVPYEGRNVRTVQALGNGGQNIIAIPELDLAIVFLGGNYSDGKPANYARKTLLPKFILPAVTR